MPTMDPLSFGMGIMLGMAATFFGLAAALYWYTSDRYWDD